MMDKELKDWIKGYLCDILCGFFFWGAVFGICLAVMALISK
jgi:hypothetical protein